MLVACDIVCSQCDDAIKAFTKMYGVLYNRAVSDILISARITNKSDLRGDI